MTNPKTLGPAPVTKVATGIYSFLSPEDLANLRDAIRYAYPTADRNRRRQLLVTNACQPQAAYRLIELVARERAIDHLIGKA